MSSHEAARFLGTPRRVASDKKSVAYISEGVEEYSSDYIVCFRPYDLNLIDATPRLLAENPCAMRSGPCLPRSVVLET